MGAVDGVEVEPTEAVGGSGVAKGGGWGRPLLITAAVNVGRSLGGRRLLEGYSL